MTAHSSSSRAIDSRQTAATRLLESAATASDSPVERLLDRLCEDDGDRWFDSALQAGPACGAGPADRLLTSPGPSLEALKLIKQKSKLIHQQATDEETRLPARLTYFLVQAAALAHHGVLISSLDRKRVISILTDLAEVVPPQWRALLDRAVKGS